MSSFDESLGDELARERFWKATHVLDVCESTNDFAMSLASIGCQNGTVVIAKLQTGGKGRQGRRWESWPGSLALSIVLRPSLKLAQSHRLVLSSALATVEALEKIGIASAIKWPNDILIEAPDSTWVQKLGPYRKIGGMLLELSSTNICIDAAIIGIGINITRPIKNDEVERMPHIGFLSDIGSSSTLGDVTTSVLDSLEHRFSTSLQDDTFPTVLGKVREKSVLLGKRVQVDIGDVTFEGVAEDLDHDGGLVIRLDDHSSKIVHFGDVSLVR